MTSAAALIKVEGARWTGCVVTPSRQSYFDGVAVRLVRDNAKVIYQRIEARTSVPWFVVAVIHEREASQNFTRQLGQGDPLNAKSIHVPKGWGPYFGATAFEDAAYDALMKAAPQAGKWTDWSIGGILTILEEYNGLGYAAHNMPSPYIWAGTNQYSRGKYTSDGHLDMNAVDTQLGCAGLLMAMQKLDKSIVFGAAPPVPQTTRISPSKPTVPVVLPAHPAPGPSVSHPAAGSIGDAIYQILHALFAHL